MLTLYYSSGACSLVAHILLEELQVPYKEEKVDLKTHTLDGADFYKINPQGLVPTLKLDNGEILTQNLAILIYLSELNPSLQLLPTAPMERLRALEWLGFINADLHKGFSPFFKPDAYVTSDAAKTELREKDMERLAALFALVETKLGNKTYTLGDHFSTPDAYLFVIYRWAKYMKMPLTAYPNYAALAQRVLERPAVQRAMKEEGLLK